MWLATAMSRSPVWPQYSKWPDHPCVTAARRVPWMRTSVTVPARGRVSVAVARMNDGEGDNIDIIQAQFLRSLSA